MQPKSVVFTLEIAFPEAHICTNSWNDEAIVLYFSLVNFLSLLLSQFRNLFRVRPSYQFSSDCLQWAEGMVYLGRHAAATDATGKWVAAFYGEQSGWPGGQHYFSILSRMPVKPGNLNFIVDYSGAGDFHEMQTGIGYARNLVHLYKWVFGLIITDCALRLWKCHAFVEGNHFSMVIQTQNIASYIQPGGCKVYVKGLHVFHR
jgi:hypothetical protein